VELECNVSGKKLQGYKDFSGGFQEKKVNEAVLVKTVKTPTPDHA
jgi:hypothetical protein